MDFLGRTITKIWVSVSLAGARLRIYEKVATLVEGEARSVPTSQFWTSVPPLTPGAILAPLFPSAARQHIGQSSRASIQHARSADQNLCSLAHERPSRNV